MPGDYVYIWLYVVLRARVEDFLEVYGANGEWVRLFQRAPGYLRTDLLHDTQRG